MLPRSFRLGWGLALAAATTFSPPARAQSTAFVNVALGPTIYLDGGRTQLHVSLQTGLNVARHLYVVFEPTGAFGRGGTVVTLPLGLQYDLPIRAVRHLFVYPRLMVGAGLFLDSPGTRAAFVVEPGFGIKYAVAGVWNIGFEPFDFPIYVADTSPFPTTAYRFSAVTGFNF